jgi:hypothetical protein
MKWPDTVQVDLQDCHLLRASKPEPSVSFRIELWELESPRDHVGKYVRSIVSTTPGGLPLFFPRRGENFVCDGRFFQVLARQLLHYNNTSTMLVFVRSAKGQSLPAASAGVNAAFM